MLSGALHSAVYSYGWAAGPRDHPDAGGHPVSDCITVIALCKIRRKGKSEYYGLAS